MTRATGLAGAAVLGAGVALGALLPGDDSTSSGQADTRQGGTNPMIKALSFETRGPTDRRVILDLGGLTVTAKCKRYRIVANPEKPYADTPRKRFDSLSVTARSAFNGASIVSSFMQREGAKGPATYPYVFALRDFGPGYGGYDFLGTPYKVSGDLHYSRPDGGQVSVSYAADQQRTTDGCRFGGTAAFAPG